MSDFTDTLNHTRHGRSGTGRLATLFDLRLVEPLAQSRPTTWAWAQNQ